MFLFRNIKVVLESTHSVLTESENLGRDVVLEEIEESFSTPFVPEVAPCKEIITPQEEIPGPELTVPEPEISEPEISEPEIPEPEILIQEPEIPVEPKISSEEVPAPEIPAPEASGEDWDKWDSDENDPFGFGKAGPATAG